MTPWNNASYQDLMKPGKEAFDYWISFFPTAPMFGVEWRFGETVKGKAPASPKAPVSKSAKPAPSAKVVQKPSETSTAKPTPVKAEAAEKLEPPKTVAKASKPKAVTKPASKAKPIAAKVSPKKAEKKPAAGPKAPVAPKDGSPKGLLAEKPADASDLKLIKGVGPGLEKELNGLGVYTFTQIAGYKKADLTWIDERLTAFKGRCFRDDWIGQAKALLA